jgi:hypothetical protein
LNPQPERSNEMNDAPETMGNSTTEKKGLSRLKPVRSGLLFMFGIILPFGTLVFEVVTGWCTELLFDPIPTIGHALLVAVVPGANFLVWLALTKDYRRNLVWLGLANGAAIAISAYYALLFIPVLPIAVMGLAAIIYFGLGLLSFLPMAPMFSFLCALRYRRLARLKLCAGGRLPGSWRGALLAAALLMAVSLPGFVTKLGLRLAASPNPETSITGIKWLRTMGRDDIMLRACYQIPSGPVDLASWAIFADGDITTEKARKVYFRVTGKAFNTKPAPDIWAGRGGRWQGADEFDFDMEQGGEVVAGRLKGLSLSDSRIDGSVDAGAALGYLEWTMVFRNDSSQQREARAQILLPPDAVVSRLTLWINGEEREAAFGGRSRVREAYQNVVRRRRDPVLVTTCGPDRILMQCFPVPPNGGEMKTRIGITVPLVLAKADSGLLVLPRMLERNFGIAADKTHSIWIEGDGAFSSEVAEFLEEKPTETTFAIRGDIKTDALNSPKTSIEVSRDASILNSWAGDSVGRGQHGVLQVLKETAAAVPDRIVVVIDGSHGMGDYISDIAAAIEASTPESTFAVLVASDRVIEVSGVGDSTPDKARVAAKELRGLKCVGGQDNTPALLAGWDLAAQSDQGVVLWIHGPQRYLLSAGEQLRQRLTRRPGGPVLYEIQTAHGPDRLIEKMDGLIPVRHVCRKGEFQDDLTSLLRSWQATTRIWTAERERKPLKELPRENIKESSRHLVRLWAHDRVMDDFASGDKLRIEAATAMGLRYSLVTPLTGAVVLENQQQYRDAGLEPVPPGSVPTVPEPEIWAMIIIALFLIVWVGVRPRLCRAGCR